MPLFTEREGLRSSPDKRDQMADTEYDYLFDVCERFFLNLAYHFPIRCKDNNSNITEIDLGKFKNYLVIRIPNLFSDKWSEYNSVVKDFRTTNYDQFAIFDLIEYVAKNIRDYKKGNYHSYYSHYELEFNLQNNQSFKEFQNLINDFFDITGLQYQLKDSFKIEQKITTGAAATIVPVIETIKEPYLKELLDLALSYFKSPKPSDKRNAVEKLWDAFERLKTYHTSDKKYSTDKIIKDMAAGNEHFKSLFEAEFYALKDIGNRYTIRHHETNTITISNSEDFDYFFNRCLALIERALKTLT